MLKRGKQDIRLLDARLYDDGRCVSCKKLHEDLAELLPEHHLEILPLQTSHKQGNPINEWSAGGIPACIQIVDQKHYYLQNPMGLLGINTPSLPPIGTLKALILSGAIISAILEGRKTSSQDSLAIKAYLASGSLDT